MNEQVINDARKIYKVLDSKKIESLEVLDVHELTTITELFIIVVVNSTRGTKALADELEFRMEHEENLWVYQKEGYDTGTWILLDYGHVIVHILHKDDAIFYGIERLWQDGKTLIL